MARGSDTIDNVKGQIQAFQGIRPYDQRIMLGVKQLDSGKLSNYNIKEESTLRMVSTSCLILCLLLFFCVCVGVWIMWCVRCHCLWKFVSGKKEDL
jgi:hypothetical protein